MQLALDVTLVSAHHEDGTDEKDGVVLKLARIGDSYSELCDANGRARLVVDAFLEYLAHGNERSAPRILPASAQVQRTAGVLCRSRLLCWRSGVTLGAGRGACPGCTRCLGMLVRCDAEACSGDCGTDFFIVAWEKESGC